VRIFVAGAGGFIGRRTAAFLEAMGHSVVRHVRGENGDLRADDLPEGTEVFVNAAGRLGGPSAGMEDLRRANVEPVRLLAGWVPKGAFLVHLSTPGVAGLRAGGREDDPPAPWGPYEETKAEAERLLASVVPAGHVTILRPDFVYGPGDAHKLALFRQLARGWLPLVGRGLSRIRPTFVDDVASAVGASLPGGPLSGGLYNVGGPEVVTVRDFATMSARAMGRGVWLPAVPRAVYTAAMLLGPLRPPALSASRLELFGRDHFVEIAKAAEAGFSCPTNLREGLRLTVEAYASEGLI